MLPNDQWLFSRYLHHHGWLILQRFLKEIPWQDVLILSSLWESFQFQEAMDVLGLETECVFSSEIKQYAIKAYKDFYGKDEVVNGDITQIDVVDIPDFDVLLAGFPCQPFSSAVVRKGFKDTRGTMLFSSFFQ